jgi:hypothetical protein
MVFFIASIFTMRGRWIAAAKAGRQAHDAEVARQLALLPNAGGTRRGTDFSSESSATN